MSAWNIISRPYDAYNSVYVPGPATNTPAQIEQAKLNSLRPHSQAGIPLGWGISQLLPLFSNRTKRLPTIKEEAAIMTNENYQQFIEIAGLHRPIPRR